MQTYRSVCHFSITSEADLSHVSSVSAPIGCAIPKRPANSHMDLADVTRVMMSYLDNRTIGVLIRSGIAYESETFRDQYWWHERVETITGRRVPFDTRVQWDRTYLILERELAKPEPRFWNDEDNALVSEFLLQMGYDPKADTRAPIDAVTHGSINILTFLLSPAVGLDPNLRHNKFTLLMLASTEGRVEIVELLLSHPNINPNSLTMSSNAVIEACLVSHSERADDYLEIVRLLLEDGRCDPSWNHSASLRAACKNGDNAEIVRLLLSDGRADPDEAGVLTTACKAGRDEIVRLLLADPRVNPNEENGEALSEAADKGHVSVVAILLEDGRVDPNAQSGTPLLVSLQRDGTGDHSRALGALSDYNEIVRLLLSDPRTDGAIDDNRPLEAAIENSNVEAVEMLLARDDVLDALDDGMLAFAEEVGDVEIIEMVREALGAREQEQD